jgi:hypothetical protein
VPDAETARFEILDLQGRVWERRPIETQGAGRHALDIALGGRLPAGLYWAQLSRRGETRRLMFAVVQ